MVLGDGVRVVPVAGRDVAPVPLVRSKAGSSGDPICSSPKTVLRRSSSVHPNAMKWPSAVDGAPPQDRADPVHRKSRDAEAAVDDDKLQLRGLAVFVAALDLLDHALLTRLRLDKASGPLVCVVIFRDIFERKVAPHS